MVTFMMHRKLSAFLLLCFVGTAVGQRGDQPPRVVVASVVKQEVDQGRAFVGTVWPIRVSRVGSAASGRVEKVYFDKEGDRVRKGEPLVQLRTKIIQAQLDAAKAARDARKAELEEMEAGNRKEEIAQAQARVESAQALHEFRQQQLRRARALEGGRGVSREELEEAISQANTAEALLREAKVSLDLQKAGFRAEKIAQARARLREQEAVVRQLEEQLERHTVVAPFDGYIVGDHAEEGQWLMTGELVAEVSELDDVYVQAQVLEDYISQIREGDEAQIKLDAIPGKPFFGKVEVIMPRGDRQARTFPVKVRVANERQNKGVLLKSGMFARVTFSVGRPVEAILVPKDALVLEGKNPTVCVVSFTEGNGTAGGKGTVKCIPVDLGVSQGGMIQVLGNLKPGQWVVTQGNERLRPGQEVRTSPGTEKKAPGR